VKRVVLVVSGDVVGVGFRSWTLGIARKLSLNGWVKNRQDGSVEILAEGTKNALEQLIKECQHGPDIAWVNHVEIAWTNATGEFVTFEVVY